MDKKDILKLGALEALMNVHKKLLSEIESQMEYNPHANAYLRGMWLEFQRIDGGTLAPARFDWTFNVIVEPLGSTDVYLDIWINPYIPPLEYLLKESYG